MTMGAHSAERKQVMRALAQAKALARGLDVHGSLLTGMVVAGKKITVAQAQKRFQRMFAAAEKAEASKRALERDLAARDAAILPERDFLTQYSASVLGFLGPKRPELKVFGLPSGERRKRTQAEEAVSAALRRATRKVRGTMGPKQRAALTAAGRPGLLLVDPKGNPIGDAALPPIPPAKPRK
jgi:hypothetical protein